MSSLQRRFGLPTDLTPFICHSVHLIVHLSSFIQGTYPAHSHFVLVIYWTMFVTLALSWRWCYRFCFFSLILSIFLSMSHWLVSSFFSNAFERDHLWHPSVIAGKTHWLKTFLFRLMGRCLSKRFLFTFQKHSILLLFWLKLLVFFCFLLLLFVPDIYC